MTHNNNQNVKGFTLLETITSIGILALVIIGPLSVIVSSSSYARQTKDVIVASYLAEESVELLQNQYDSLYIYCQKKPDDAFCALSPTDKSVGQAVWRNFKARLGPNASGPSCYTIQNPDGTTGNPHGCSFDYTAMTKVSTTTPPVRYDATSASCPYLVEVSTTTTITTEVAGNGCYEAYRAALASPENANGISAEAFYYSYCTSHGVSSGDMQQCMTSCTLPTVTYAQKEVNRHLYVCKSQAQALAGETGTVGTKSFKRSLAIEQVSTFESGLPNTQYNDDLRVTSNVQFKGINGLTHTVKVVRFMHSLP